MTPGNEMVEVDKGKYVAIQDRGDNGDGYIKAEQNM